MKQTNNRRQSNFNETTPRQKREEFIIFEGMKRRKLNGIVKHGANIITDLDVEINDEIAMLEAEFRLWNLHADEKIIVKTDLRYNPN